MDNWILKDSIHTDTMIKLVREYNYNRDKLTHLYKRHQINIYQKYGLTFKIPDLK